MKKLIVIVAGIAMGIAGHAQSVSLYQGETEVMNCPTESIDSIVFKSKAATGTMPVAARAVKGHWCALGTSITWYNENVSSQPVAGSFTRGYQSRVMDRLKFSQYSNQGVNGGVVKSAIDKVIRADYYTIEHGINDWAKNTAVGTIDDYINNTNNGTFAANYRVLIDKIYATNPDAKIVLCTPRKAYGFNGFLPAHWYDPKHDNNTGKDIYLKDYVDIVRQIAEYESLPLADFFAECGAQHNLQRLSIDVALHPNDAGYQLMANVLLQALEKTIVD